MTVGLPPSTTETTEFVVPRSIPMTFAISLRSVLLAGGRVLHSKFGGGPRGPLRASPWFGGVVLDFLLLAPFGLRQLALPAALTGVRPPTRCPPAPRQVESPS